MAVSATCRQSVVGRVRAKAAMQPEPKFHSALNSFCLPCGQWFFGQYLAKCTRCQAPIFRWLGKDEFRLMASRSSLHGF